MKAFSKICFFVVLAILFSGNVAAQEAAQTHNNLLSYYDTELFQWSYSTFGGLTLNYKNQSSITAFGIKEAMKDALVHYEDTNQRYHSFRSKTIVGNILKWGGLTAVLAGAYVPLFGDWEVAAYEKNAKIGLGIVLGGLVTELIGVIVLQSGQENIFDAVNLYNRHRINEYK
jgi:predicted aldo/keto reductase-like oxidoreductase